MAIDPKDIHDMDQSSAFLAETLPPLLFNFYKGFIKEGFTSDQAFILTRDYLRYNLGGPIDASDEDD